MTGLSVAPGLNLDPDYVGGGAFAVLAKRGAGKTYTGRVMAEEMWDAGVPFVVLDPMGAWWGLRAEGDGPGIPIPIFGGEHGDAPLERTGGAVMADLIVDEGLSAILDLSAFGSRAAERQFALDFLERLYRRNRRLLHVFVDEADLFAPQKPAPGDQRLLGAAENVVRRGRNRGLGSTWFTQRPAVLNKDVLTQMDGLVAMRITGLTDREVIDAWVKGHGDQEQAALVKPTLAGLDTGESWWWIPELDVLQQVQVRRAHSFDSSPTAKRGEQRQAPKGVADIDLGAIQERLAATIERAKQDDPAELRSRIRVLEKQLAERPKVELLEPERVAVPVLTDDARAKVEEFVGTMGAMREHLGIVADRLTDALEQVRKAPTPAEPVPITPYERVRPASVRSPEPVPSPNGSVSPARQKILNALAVFESIGVDAPTKLALALFATTSPRSSGYTNNLGALRSAGLIDYPAPGTVQLTPEGRQSAVADGAVSTVPELHAYVRRLVGPAKARILDALIADYPASVAKDELAGRASTSATSSGYTNNLGNLRSLGLIDYPQPGHVVAQPVLFLEG